MKLTSEMKKKLRGVALGVIHDEALGFNRLYDTIRSVMRSKIKALTDGRVMQVQARIKPVIKGLPRDIPAAYTEMVHEFMRPYVDEFKECVKIDYTFVEELNLRGYVDIALTNVTCNK